MENKIKTLYIVTIIVITGLIVAQGVWLYNQYRVSLYQQEQSAFTKMEHLVSVYNAIRQKAQESEEAKKTHQIQRTSTQINYNRDDHTMSQTAQVLLQYETRDVRQILGNTDKTINDSLLMIARKIVYSEPMDSSLSTFQRFDIPKISIKENIWNAANSAALEHDVPFSIVGVDSIFKSLGLDVGIRLITTDSLMWNTEHRLVSDLINPRMKAVIPYSILEKKAVELTYDIPISRVIKSMGTILIISLMLSVLLIVCLIWQISTIRQLLKLDNVRNSFVHTMIHELKRPISTLKICISSLGNPRLIVDEENRNDIIDDCRMAVNNLSDYFSRLRDITFNEASQIPLNIENCDLHGMVDSIIEKTSIPSAKKVEIVNDIPSDFKIVGDRLHLSQIISN